MKFAHKALLLTFSIALDSQICPLYQQNEYSALDGGQSKTAQERSITQHSLWATANNHKVDEEKLRGAFKLKQSKSVKRKFSKQGHRVLENATFWIV